MTIFEYFLVLFSVILSLGLAHLATGIGELMRARRTVRWSLPYLLWVALSLSMIVDLWASNWLIRGTAQWSLPAILLMLASALTTFLSALWLVPRHIGDAPIDLYDYMVAERRLFVGANIAYLVTGVISNLTLFPTGHFDLANYFVAAPGLIVYSAAWISPRRWVQVAAPILGAILIVGYFAFYFPKIG